MMGCTSSTPNMPEILTNTAEITENDENINTEDMKETDDPISRNESESSYEKVSEIDVLPTCDSLDENIQLARNNNYFSNMNNERKHENTLTNDVEKEDLESEQQREEKQLSTLKQVADQVLVKNILEDVNNTPTLYQEKPSNEDEKAVVEEKVTELIMETITDGVEDTNDEDKIEESASPSQSNRSTRWEALADIAAELPPSLAVDPVTGQIYSLTK